MTPEQIEARFAANREHAFKHSSTFIGDLDADIVSSGATGGQLVGLLNARNRIAEIVGVLHCSCGHPINNHFKRKEECLHDCHCTKLSLYKLDSRSIQSRRNRLEKAGK